MSPNTKTISVFAIMFFINSSFPNILLIHADEVGHKPSFAYEQQTGKGPSEWGKLNPKWEVCNSGKLQSPIDITNKRVSLIHDHQALRRDYKSAPAVIINRGHDIMVSWKGQDAGKITINQTHFRLETVTKKKKKKRLEQCHWHLPAEHTINATRYDLEQHMVHISAEGKIAVVAILYKLGEPDQFLTKIQNEIKAVEKVNKDVGMVDAREIKFETNKFYRYIGSLTSPPCTEGVIWTIVKKVKTISEEQITALREAVDDGFERNSRPVQDLHGRMVWLSDQN